jgi:hypothetical protein
VLRRLLVFAGCAVAAVAAAGCTGSTPHPVSPPATPVITVAPPTRPPATPTLPAPSPAGHTVTYIVTGSPADVTYGPAGSASANTSPLHVTRRLGHPAYYAITAVMAGSGRVSCQIRVDGAAVATGTATGPYGIALCKIIRDPFTGAWTDVRQEPPTETG